MNTSSDPLPGRMTPSYSLNAFNGTKGRMEHGAQEEVPVGGDGSVPGALKPDGTGIKIFILCAPQPTWWLSGRVKTAMEAATDDYLPKPFALEAFIACVRALLRAGRMAGRWP